MAKKIDLSSYFDKVLSILRVTSVAHGLEISDTALRLVYMNKSKWQMKSVRMSPGVMEKGKIKDYSGFVTAMKELRSSVLQDFEKRKKINIIVSLSSLNIYSQVFNLPLIEGENLEKAIDLNIQMVSPVEAKEVYSGWQILAGGEAASRLDILVAFADRSTVDDVTKGLFEAGFVVMAME